MKTNKKLQHQQRYILDQKIANFSLVSHLRQGWIKSIRNSLGISIRQLAALMKVSKTSVNQLESSERKKSITIKKLETAAAAMDCELVYFFIPKKGYQSFEDILDKKSKALALNIAQGVSHSMTLEQQKVDTQITNSQIQALALELKQSLDSRMWSYNKKAEKMSIKLEYPPGATPLDPNELDGLIPEFISTQAELNMVEQENILAGKNWALKSKKDPLDEIYVRELHRKMYSKVWRWAGVYRKTQKTIGIDAAQISIQLLTLMNDTKIWIELHSYPWPEILARFHHRLVYIHPFANGNGRYARMHTEFLAIYYEQNIPTWGSQKFRGNINMEGEIRQQYISALREADQKKINLLISFLYS